MISGHIQQRLVFCKSGRTGRGKGEWLDVVQNSRVHDVMLVHHGHDTSTVHIGVDPTLQAIRLRHSNINRDQVRTFIRLCLVCNKDTIQPLPKTSCETILETTLVSRKFALSQFLSPADDKTQVEHSESDDGA